MHRYTKAPPIRPRSVRIIDEDDDLNVPPPQDDVEDVPSIEVEVKKFRPVGRTTDRHDSMRERQPRREQDGIGMRESDDLSPPRKNRERKDDDNELSTRKRDDLALFRKRTRDDEDLSPPRKPRDLSPPRKSQDISPQRRSQDVSPPRRSRDISPPRKPKTDNAKISIDKEPVLRAAREDTVYRDKLGRKITLEDLQREKELEKETKRQQDKELEHLRKGTVQQFQQAAYQQNLERMKTTQFARTKDDKDLNDELKSKMHWNDPLLNEVKRKEVGYRPEKTGRIRKVYQGPGTCLNRFGILPGWQWDGVDRGNGFEEKWFAAHARRQALAQEAYKWGAEDM